VEAILNLDDGAMGADLDALAAPPAALLKNHQAGFWAPALGIVAPPAAKWAAFEKHGGPNTRPIVHRVPPDIKN
jgi:hypothetical protein